MTTNFGGCEERRTMAAQPSAQNEDRHLLRRLAWEQRNQETSQAKESNHEIVPLFGEPYKTNGGDELSNRIQRMLGRYEDVNSPSPVAMVPLPVPSGRTPSQSDRSDTCTDLRAKAPPLSEVQRTATQSQKGSSGIGQAPQASPTSTLVSPDRHRSTSPSSADPGQQQQKVEAQTSLREHADLFQGVSSQSPAASAVALASPCLQTVKQEVTEPHSADRQQPEGLKHFPGAVDMHMFNSKQSPEDLPVAPANKGNLLPAQTFSSLLSKQPSVVMTQKPTAYVRPMDGPDQVVSESPELKPSPDSYTPPPELIIKTEPDKDEMPLQFLETKTNEALCVADILREMTCSWPPVLAAIKSPCKAEPLKSPSPTKEVQHISSHPGQKEFLPSPADSSRHTHDNSLSVQVAHSGAGDSPSSSDSDSSFRSESDGDSIADGQPRNPDCVLVKTEPDAPEPIQVDWQLGNWIRPSQHNSGFQGPRSSNPSQSPAHKQPGPLQTLNHTSVPVAEPKARKRSQKCDKTSQDCHKQQSLQTAPSVGQSGRSRKRLSAAAKADCVDAALALKHGDAEAPKKEMHFLDGHKAKKTKTHQHKRNKEKGDDKRDSSRSSKHKSHTKEKAAAEPKALAALWGGCSTCGVQHPNPCTCPTLPGQLPLSCPGEITCSKPKSVPASGFTAKSPHRTAQKHRTKTGHDAQRSQDANRPPKSLPVKIDLSLLLRVPQNSGNHHHNQQHHQQEAASKAKRSKVEQQDPGGAGSKASTTQNLTKSSRKTKPPHAEVDSTIPRKKPRLENGCSSPSRASAKRQVTVQEPERKKAEKNHSLKESHKCTGGEVGESSKDAAHNKKESSKKKKKSSSSGKLPEQPHCGKENPKGSSSSLKTKEPVANRPLLKSDHSGLHPVTHYIEEAKRLKHKADAEKDKCRKAFCYLEAAMYFVESGIAMEKDTHTSRSSYTMFADTVDMLRFVLNNVLDASLAPSEKDSLKVLCLKCQSLLQMAMFHQKHKIALKYSKTLTSHFNNAGQKTPNPTVSTPRVTDTPPPLLRMPSPAITSSSCSGSGSLPDPSNGSVSLPVNIQQTAFSYVNITTLFLNAHDMWEQAEEVALRAGGMLKEVDGAVGPLSLTSSMVFMVRYIRQAVNRLRLRGQKGK